MSRLRLGDRSRIRAALVEARPATAAAELALLERLARPPKAALPQPKPSGEILRPGLVLKTERKGQKLTVTLAGPAVDDALAEAVRGALRQMERPGRG